MGLNLAELKKELGKEANTDERFIQAVVASANRLAEIFSKFCDDDELRACMPNEARNREVGEEFKRRNADILARLCQ